MLELKKKHGISLKQIESSYLANWLDEYFPPDEVLTFEMYSLKDIEMLYKEGVVLGGTEAMQK